MREIKLAREIFTYKILICYNVFIFIKGGVIIKFFTKDIRGFMPNDLMVIPVIIAFLILVMVPRIGVVKSKTIEAGVKANLLMVEGIVRCYIDDYTTSSSDILALENRLASEINNDDKTKDAITNTLTGNVGAKEKKDISYAAVSYLISDDNTDDGVDIDSNWPESLENSSGVIVYCAYRNTATKKINIKLIPYGPDGKRITDLEKVISQ